MMMASIAVGAVLVASGGRASATDAASVRDACLETYFDGITATVAHDRLGDGAVPALVQLLRDPGFQRRDNVVGFLAFLGDAEASRALVQFLANPPADVTVAEEDRALLLAPQALGHIAARGKPEALAALLAMTAPGGRVKAPPGLRTMDQARFERDVRAMAIRGLALSRAAAAQTRLTELARDGAADTDGLRAAARSALSLLAEPAHPAGEAGPDSRHLKQGAPPAAASASSPIGAMTCANHATHPLPMTDGRLDQVLAYATQAATGVQVGGDVACNIVFGRSGTCLSFGSPGDGRDIIDDDAELRVVLSDLTARVHVVRAINTCGGVSAMNILGCSRVGAVGMSVVRRSDAKSEGLLWLHEYGHNADLGHNGDPAFVMYRLASGGEGLTDSECTGLVNHAQSPPREIPPQTCLPLSGYPAVGVVGVPGAPNGAAWLLAANGGVFTLEGAPFLGSAAAAGLDRFVGIAAHHSGTGYWLVTSLGEVFPFGAATFHGDRRGQPPLNSPVVGIAADPLGRGYWLIAADGGIFTYGEGLPFFGSTGDLQLNAPMVGMAAHPSGEGYWLLGADGGVFTFGPGARFWGSTGDMRLNEPVIGMIPTGTGDGYWLFARDGGVFSFGDARFAGSLGSAGIRNAVGMALRGAQGYWIVTADGCSHAPAWLPEPPPPPNCDDGNDCTDDGFDASGCRHAFAPRCFAPVLSLLLDGRCGDGVGDTDEECDAGNTPNCDPAPRPGCDSPGKSSLTVTHGKVSWNFQKGTKTRTLADFGSPTTTTGYAFCLYNGGALEWQAKIAAGPAWRQSGQTAYAYKAAAGITKVTLKGGDAGKPKLQVKGRGSAVATIATPMGVPIDVAVQLVNDANANCWSDTYTAARANGVGTFKAARD